MLGPILILSGASITGCNVTARSATWVQWSSRRRWGKVWSWPWLPR